MVLYLSTVIQMIIDSIKHIKDYKSMFPYLEEGLEVLKQIDLSNSGKYEFNHGYFMIQEGETKPFDEGMFESHRKFIDLQILIEGSEEIAWNDIDDMSTVVPYDKTTDKQRLNGSWNHNILISEGMFWAAFPWDGHKAISHTNEKHRYKKIVMKLPIEKGE